MLTAMVAAASGCARVIVVDVVESKIRTAETLAPGVIEGVLIGPGTESQIMEMTNGGADVVLECAGNVRAAEAAVQVSFIRAIAFFQLHQYAAPGGRVLLIGCSTGDPTLSLGTIQVGWWYVCHISTCLDSRANCHGYL